MDIAYTMYICTCIHVYMYCIHSKYLLVHVYMHVYTYMHYCCPNSITLYKIIRTCICTCTLYMYIHVYMYM